MKAMAPVSRPRAVAALALAAVVALAPWMPRGGQAGDASDGAGVAGPPGGVAVAGAGLTPAATAGAGRGTARITSHRGSWTSLATAVAASEAGDTLRVGPGVLRSATVELDRALTLLGEPGAILENSGTAGLLRITAAGVTIRGLTLRGTPYSHVRDHAAILVEGADHCRIEENRLEDNFFGIYLARSRGCRVSGNVITAGGDRESTSGNGIHLWNAADADVSHNVIRGHRDGIYLEHVQRARLHGNVSEDNLRYGLHFMFSSSNQYVENQFRRNRAGVAVMYSRDVLVHGNVFEDNWGAAAYGLLIKDIYDSTISDNIFRRNTVALSSEGSTRVELTGNRFVRNGWAVRVLASSQENRFTGNDFVDNAFDVTTNSRQNPNTFEGNYWSRYGGYDLTGDGIGDVPHRPVRLFALLVQRSPSALVLLRSAFLDVLEVAERVAPVLTPETLVDERPLMREAAR
jgi:nitrous oxidase accessory protein